MERIAIMMLLLALVFILLPGCGQIPLSDRVIEQHQENKQSTATSEVESIGNMKSIGEALGCVFAPQSCQKSK